MTEESEIEALKQRIRELEEKVENSNTESKENKKKKDLENVESNGISRREFLKKAGLGTAGLAALMSPVSSLDVRDDSFNVYTGTGAGDLQEYFNVAQGGPVNVMNADLDLNNDNSLVNVNQINGQDADNLSGVEDHSQLTGVTSDQHHSRYTDSEASDAAPVQSVNGQTGSVSVDEGVSDHSELSGVTSSQHHSRYSDSEASDAAPVQSVNGRDGSVSGLFEASDYDPEGDTHDRYTDAEASDAAPVQSVNGQQGDVEVGVVPEGVITMWSGDETDIPANWTLCDGTDGAPDLRDRFVVGAGDAYAADDTGGQESVSLDESELPSHNHGSGSLSTSTDGEHTHGVDLHDTFYNGLIGDDGGTGNQAPDPIREQETQAGGEHSHEVGGMTDATGGNDAHENRPPYYALAFIMKL